MGLQYNDVADKLRRKGVQRAVRGVRACSQKKGGRTVRQRTHGG